MRIFKRKQADLPRRRLESDSVRPAANPAYDVFRRNRTITGTTSNIFAAVNAPADLESQRLHTHKLKNHRRNVSGVLVILVLSSAILWTLVSNFTAGIVIKVPASNVVAAKSIDNSRYVKVVQDYLDANPLSRLKFILDQSSLDKYISNKLPEVISARQQEMAGVGSTVFIVNMRVPVAGWSMNGKQYYVDSKGISFDKNCFAEPDVQIVDNSGASPASGSSAIVSNRFLGFVGRVVALSKSSGYPVSQAILPPDTTRELDMKLKNSTIAVKLSIDRPAGEQIEDMSQALKYFALHQQSPSYIDVRVSGKAFYK